MEFPNWISNSLQGGILIILLIAVFRTKFFSLRLGGWSAEISHRDKLEKMTNKQIETLNEISCVIKQCSIKLSDHETRIVKLETIIKNKNKHDEKNTDS